METQREEMEIDLIDLFYYLKKRIWLIVMGLLAFALVGAAYTVLFMDNEYTAKTRMYVLSRSSENTISSADYSTANYMIKDYEVLITGENVTREVINRLGLDMTAAELTGKISVTAIDSTRVLQIVVVDNNPQRAANIANCVREVSSEQIKQIMAVDAVNLVYAAEVPQAKSGPSLSKNTVIGGVLGMILVMGILVVIYMLDDTIRTDEDVTRYLGLETLGVIPASKELDNYKKLGGAQTQRRTGIEKLSAEKTAAAAKRVLQETAKEAAKEPLQRSAKEPAAIRLHRNSKG